MMLRPYVACLASVLLAVNMLTPLMAAEMPSLKQHDRQAIQAVLDAQIVSWNHGDLEGFMAGYWHSPDLVYFRNDAIIRGWQPLLDHYRQRFKPAGGIDMGSLTLTEEQITVLDRNAVLVWGKYRVLTTDHKERGGLYTLAMRRLPEGWRTVYDRTSSEQLAGSEPKPAK